VNVGGTAPFQASKMGLGSCRSDTGRRLEQTVQSCTRHVRRRRR
jgi:hypothetical protein